jgi:hypothetical protein
MIITILSSIKLYLNLSNNINDEIQLSKAYYILSINIYKNIIMKQGNPKIFLEETFGEYTKLIEQSSILYKNIHKDLLTINEYCNNKPISSNNSTSSSDSYTSNDDKDIIITNSLLL